MPLGWDRFFLLKLDPTSRLRPHPSPANNHCSVITRRVVATGLRVGEDDVSISESLTELEVFLIPSSNSFSGLLFHDILMSLLEFLSVKCDLHLSLGTGERRKWTLFITVCKA